MEEDWVGGEREKGYCTSEGVKERREELNGDGRREE